MQCPYCETELKDSEELNFHALKCHPEKTTLVEFREAINSRMWITATELTRMTFNNENHKKDNVLRTFKFFLRELMISERE